MSIRAAPKALTVVEIDMPRCANTYGVAPCTASIPATGAIKCFNTPNTCQDRDNYIEAPLTLRFAGNRVDLPRELDALAMIKSVTVSPSIVSLGRSLGHRESVSVTFRDRPHSDTGGLDPYLADRAYDPYRQGTFFGKFRARSPFLRSRKFRLMYGFIGAALPDFETRHYLIDGFDGPTPAGEYTITAKDPLKGLDDDRSLAPKPSKGHLNGDITATATSATLAPSGIGNSDYPASGYLNLGGSEICAFTRSADTLTFASSMGNRVASFGTVPVSHQAQDRVQLCLYYNGQDPGDTISDLCTNYAAVDPTYIPIYAWNTETAAFLDNAYTAMIPEPTGVKTLVEELIEQAALSLWWDPLLELIRLRVLRPIPTDAQTWDESRYVQGSLQVTEQPDLRVSQVWTYFAQINPLKDLGQLDNFRSTEVTIDGDAETDYGSSAIKVIKSRWIPQGGRTVAARMNAKHLARYRDPPRRFNFQVPKSSPVVVRPVPELGTGYKLKGFLFQDATGAAAEVPIQATSIAPDDAHLAVEAEEMLFAAIDDSGGTDPTIHDIVIDSNSFNINVRSLHDALYAAPESGDTVNFTVLAGVTVGSTSTASPAVDTGTFPAGVTVTLTIVSGGRIEGHGGDGPTGPLARSSGAPGLPGGTALKVQTAVLLDDDGGEIWGGGGGGGAGAGQSALNPGGHGGGGAGSQPGSGLSPGTTEAGGPGLSAGGLTLGGAGGGPGLAGATGGSWGSTLFVPGVGGAAGAAIDGVSYVTTVGSAGDRRGGQIN